MKGNKILINGNEPEGRFITGIISGAGCAPGMAMEIVPATEPVNGMFTYRRRQTGSNGDKRPLIVLLEDTLQGVKPDVNGANVYTAGSVAQLYAPINGDELNLLVENLSGTADSHAIGDQLMVDVASGFGKWIVQASAANSAPATLEETSAALTADTLLACRIG